MGNKVGGLSLRARLFREEEVSEDRIDKIWNHPRSSEVKNMGGTNIGVED